MNESDILYGNRHKNEKEFQKLNKYEESVQTLTIMLFQKEINIKAKWKFSREVTWLEETGETAGGKHYKNGYGHEQDRNVSAAKGGATGNLNENIGKDGVFSIY